MSLIVSVCPENAFQARDKIIMREKREERGEKRGEERRGEERRRRERRGEERREGEISLEEERGGGGGESRRRRERQQQTHGNVCGTEDTDSEVCTGASDTQHDGEQGDSSNKERN